MLVFDVGNAAGYVDVDRRSALVAIRLCVLYLASLADRSDLALDSTPKKTRIGLAPLK